MSSIKTMPLMAVKLPEKEIFIRLRTKPRELAENELEKMRQTMQKAFKFCQFVCSYKEVSIEVTSDSVKLDDGTIWHSVALAKNLNNCQKAVIFGVTLGSLLPQEGSKLFEQGHSAEAIIYDATGSESVEAAADLLENELRRHYARNRQVLKKFRFSPGYGNWDLTGQRDFFRILSLEKIGITLTEQLFMQPEKTITAIIGIENGETND